ncbi:MAG: AAA family ATPase [Syntrophales bacterium]
MSDKRVCSICAWRQHCQKRFIVSTDALFNVNCPDYTRDITIRDSDVDYKVVEYQLDRWRMVKKPKNDFVVTISRQPGAGGSEMARCLAGEFGMDLMGSQIIQKVAESSNMSTKVVATLDEKAVSRIDSMINSMFENRHLSPDVYFRHLTRVIATIGEHGNAIIVGRGANFILPREKTLRVRVIAPLKYRVRHFMDTRGLSHAEAVKYVEKRDFDRQGFIKKYFKVDPADPGHYDIVVNTESIGIQGATQVVSGAIRHRMKIEAEAKKITAARA